MSNPRGRDLLSSSRYTAGMYEQQVIRPIRRDAKVWEENGARVFFGANLDTLSNALNTASSTPLYLLSHWQESPEPAIEFMDGMANIQDVANQFPSDYCGVIDLCVCRSLRLAKLLKNRCPRAIIKWVNADVPPAVGLQLLKLTLQLMIKLKIDYLTAVDMSLRRLLDDN